MTGIFGNKKRLFVVYAAITFVVLLIITQLLVYQRYSIGRAHDQADLEHELDEVRGRFQAILQHNISSAHTIAMLYQHDKSLAWFDSSSAKLLGLNKGLDMVQLHQGSVVKRVYPLKGNEGVLGVDAMIVPRFRKEAELTTKAGAVQFAGPYDMYARKDKAIAGRVSLFDQGKFAGRAVVVTSFTSIFKLIPEFRNQGRKFVFQLSKKNPLTGQEEHFFNGYTPRKGLRDSAFMPQGNWTIHAAYAEGYGNPMPLYLLALFGVLVSAMGAMFMYHRVDEVKRMEQAVGKKTHDLGERMKELTTIYQVNEILKDELQSVDIALSRVVNILPAGWQYPEACAARIVLENSVYATRNFTETTYKQQTPLKFTDGRTGHVEVVYLKKQPREDEGPFLKEERNLINSIAETIELFYNKKFHREKVTRSEGAMRSLIEAIPIGIVLCDKDYNILIVNSVAATRYAETMGKTIEVGDNFVEALMPDDREPVYEVFAKVMQTLESIEYEGCYALPHGQLHINITVAPVLRDGKSIGVCVAMSDITNRKLKEHEHKRIVEDLEKHLAAMEEFVQLVKDKAQTSLLDMTALAVRAKAEADEQSRTAILEKIDQSVQQMESVIESMEEELNKKKN